MKEDETGAGSNTTETRPVWTHMSDTPQQLSDISHHTRAMPAE